MNAITLHLGLVVHKDSITIAIAEPGCKSEIRLFGTITNDIDRLEKALSRIRKAHHASSSGTLVGRSGPRSNGDWFGAGS